MLITKIMYNVYDKWKLINNAFMFVKMTNCMILKN